MLPYDPVLNNTNYILGAYEQESALNFLFTTPEIIWEASLAIWLTTKGFRPAPLITAVPPEQP
ncbi:hypothetical protein ACFOY4_39235 [Actinomadura syzygii]|uniref:Uncharacterized protein n=1 Tax=Actinomadura syzygii TaxID=1427538 RepID=A0A5D0U8I7_9ACTN|nr:hypothetical protein [Actinomadura syzygii]TYC14407.1 hypothetical protein FXF65_16230 [Actinomadura syzygii]